MGDLIRLIVGLDPGTYTGIAILELSGKIVEVAHFKNASPKDIIRFLSQRGRPLLIATDVKKIPHTVREVAVKLGARIYSPDRDLSQEEKALLTKGLDYRGDHERDALAAALKAFHSYEDVFRRIEKKIADKELRERAKEFVLRGLRASDALEVVDEFSGVEKLPKGKREKRLQKIQHMIDRIKELEEENLRLKAEIRSLRKGADPLVEHLRFELQRTKDEARIYKMMYEKALENLKALRSQSRDERPLEVTEDLLEKMVRTYRKSRSRKRGD